MKRQEQTAALPLRLAGFRAFPLSLLSLFVPEPNSTVLDNGQTTLGANASTVLAPFS